MQRKWMLEERLRKDPDDIKAQQDLEMTYRLLMKNQAIQQELEKERNSGSAAPDPAGDGTLPAVAALEP